MARNKQHLNGGASGAAVATASPPPQSAEDQIAELQTQLEGAHSAVQQLSQQVSDATFDLSVMRDRFTEELNAGNKLRADNMKLQVRLQQLELAQEGK